MERQTKGQLHDILQYNQNFVENRMYEEYLTTKFPNKKMVIVTCMDTRLTELLPKALNLRNGDVKIIKNAGAIITQPFGNIMRSILVTIYELKAREVMIIGHLDCGMTGLNADAFLEKAKRYGISDQVLDTLQHSGLDMFRWWRGFQDVRESVAQSVQIVRNHPLLPKGIPVHGLIIDPTTGKLEVVDDGYAELERLGQSMDQCALDANISPERV
ncbi:beta-class carbonic anhydrase [Paenibacillus thermoaerophilus]|uniref:carbonic anhydrase n=1 Tax=Paenibacillus thermoaerophilus TaxID=1215385 RepID=A0ABW2V3V2_9BACL|nr:carbonic anhydrase [Paenibacillus thermoaerophilus]TMV17101.1 carbonic anhydrase [Paenibacillus thermoaerophilus]